MAVIKICGLSREADIAAVNEAKPDYCGFIIDFPKSHRNVTVGQVRNLRKKLDPSVVPVGVIVDQPVEKAAMLLNEGIVDVIQLHGQEDENYIRQLRKLLQCKDRAVKDGSLVKTETKQGGLVKAEIKQGKTKQNAKIKGRIWKAFKIRSRKDFEDAMASSADAVILDNGYGTGETFDWSILADAGAMMQKKKVFLAGGLTPDNIEAVIQQLDVWGIDISSGVETDKKKDRNKILAAVQAARRAGGNKQ